MVSVENQPGDWKLDQEIPKRGDMAPLAERLPTMQDAYLVQSPVWHKMGMVVHICDLGLERWRQEHKKFKIILDYVMNFRPRGALEQPVSKKK